MREGGVDEEESVDASPETIAEEAGDLSSEGIGKVSIHVNYDGVQKNVVISQLAAKTILSVLRTVNFPSSTAMMQVGIAMQEIEKALVEIENGNGSIRAPLTRAERRRMLR
jgi:hypothetical protein